MNGWLDPNLPKRVLVLHPKTYKRLLSLPWFRAVHNSSLLVKRIFEAGLEFFGLGDRCSYNPGYYITYEGARFNDTDTLRSIGIEDGDSFDMYRKRKGGKPVIYLFSPKEVNALVRLTLIRDLNLSVVYPVVPVTTASGGETITWDAHTHLDGSLTKANTGLDVSTNPYLPASPPVSPVLGQDFPTDSFSPTTADVSPEDSELVPVREIMPYLDKALLAWACTPRRPHRS
ncbi:hypothetical protein C8J57DRAFT_1234908 [Mycena rebaudengoi]|nr:hypothetical protein C8J57DRAFT_1234908 [Mycena rebaudengoi]